MSIWYEIKDPDDIEISEDGKDFDVLFKDDFVNGNYYITIPIEMIKKRLRGEQSSMDSMDEEMERSVNKALVFWVKVVLGALTVVFGWIAWGISVGAL